MEPTIPTPADWQSKIDAANTKSKLYSVFEQFNKLKKKYTLDFIHAEILPIFLKKLAQIHAKEIEEMFYPARCHPTGSSVHA